MIGIFFYYFSIEIFETVELAAENICFFNTYFFLFIRLRWKSLSFLRRSS